jgi:hypothetical protein
MGYFDVTNNIRLEIDPIMNKSTGEIKTHPGHTWLIPFYASIVVVKIPVVTSNSGSTDNTTFAIIVPFRDNREGVRKRELLTLINYIKMGLEINQLHASFDHLFLVSFLPCTHITRNHVIKKVIRACCFLDCSIEERLLIAVRVYCR